MEMKWWVVSVMLRRWSDRTSALQAARDLYAATNPEMVRGRGKHDATASLSTVAERSLHAAGAAIAPR